MIYSAMIARLPYATEESNPRADLDVDLQVAGWPTAGVTLRAQDEDHDVPEWWEGDEQASQSFFSAMGIDPTSFAQ